jgi:DNA-directed RNA polymerase subunit E'/Rpb7
MDGPYQEKKLTTRVFLVPKELGRDYKDVILKKVVREYENTCIADIGYIHKILSLEDVHHEEVMRMSPNVFLLARVVVSAYLPKPADTLDIGVEFVMKNGVFGRFHKIQCLVPSVAWNDWELRQDFSGTFLFRANDGRSIRKGDTVAVVLRTIRFEKEVFSCIAKIK